MTEISSDLLANGAGFSAAPDPSYATGFDAGGDWDEDARYDLRKAGVNAEGVTPMPSQAKIDNFERTMAKLYIDLEKAQRQQGLARVVLDDPARELSDEDAEKLMGEFDTAKKLEHEVYDSFCEALATVCSSKPTKKQLQGLNHPTLIRFLNHIRRLLNPEV